MYQQNQHYHNTFVILQRANLGKDRHPVRGLEPKRGLGLSFCQDP